MKYNIYYNLALYNSIYSINNVLKKETRLSLYEFYKKLNLVSFFKTFYLKNNIFFNIKYPLKLKLSSKNYIYKSYNSNKLIITDSYAILPYTKKELDFYFNSYKSEYSSLDDVINKEFTKIYNISYSNSYINRFKEIYNLLRNKEQLDFFTSFRQAFKFMYNAKINPIAVSACKDYEQFNIYISFIDKPYDNVILPFKIIYNISPTKLGKHKLFI